MLFHLTISLNCILAIITLQLLLKKIFLCEVSCCSANMMSGMKREVIFFLFLEMTNIEIIFLVKVLLSDRKLKFIFVVSLASSNLKFKRFLIWENYYHISGWLSRDVNFYVLFIVYWEIYPHFGQHLVALLMLI